MKKVLLILMAVALSFGIMACDSPPEAKPTTTLSLDQVSTRLANVENRLAQAESKLSTSTNTELVAQINSLKTDVAQLKNDLAGMEAPDLAGIQQELENITNNIGVIGEQLDYNIADIGDLQAQIDAIEEPDLSELNSKVAALDVSVNNAFDWIEGLTIPDISGVEDDISTIEADIDAIKADIANVKSVYAKYTDIQALERYLQEQLDDMTDRVIALEADNDYVKVIDIDGGDITIQTNNPNVPIAVTVYGDNLDFAEAGYSVMKYGANKTMMVIIFKTSLTTIQIQEITGTVKYATASFLVE